MPRYFFHRTDGRFLRDREGMELADVDMARVEAVRFAGASLLERPDDVLKGKPLRVEMTDEDGMLLCTVAVLGIDAPEARG